MSWSALPLTSLASTVLFSHSGSTNPSTEGWNRTSTTTVEAGAYTDNGHEVWRVYDPGLAAGSGVYTNLTYVASLNAALKDSVIESGWQLSATLSMPTDDPNDSIAWSNGSNTWVGFIVNDGDTGNRRAWALTFGRDVDGKTLLSAYGSGGALTLDPGYHDYSMLYDPLTSLATITVDGEVWKTYTGGVISGTGTNQVYWGDNNGQSATQTPRAAYYESIELSIAPEPSRLAFLLLGAAGLCTARRRR